MSLAFADVMAGWEYEAAYRLYNHALENRPRVEPFDTKCHGI
jgi:hypothetical protein